MTTTDRCCLRACCVLIAGMLAGEARAVDIGILTPAYSGQMDIDADWSIAGMLTGGLADAARDVPAQANKLKELAANAGFEPIRALEAALTDEFAKQGHTAQGVTIVRRKRSGIAPLARDEVPENADARLLLDISIYYLGVYIYMADEYQPAVLLDYRWVDPTGAVVQGTRTIRYNTFLRTFTERDQGDRIFGSHKIFRSTADSVLLDTAKECHFKSFGEMQQQHAKLIGCMELALDEVAATLAKNIPSLDSSVSGGLQSSGATKMR
ncbi:MAG: hypothetical protein WDO12_14715 [Pseudomonadota bacterium]